MLYLKHRPTNLDDVVGHVKQKAAILAALKRFDRTAILITGPSGCGKTTIAHIIPTILSVPPISIHFLAPPADLAALRALTDTLSVTPLHAPARILLLDDFHLFTPNLYTHLSTYLEQLPANAHVIATATTPPPPALLSRWLHFHLHRLTAAQITAALARIFDLERPPFISPSPANLRLIIRRHNGNLRAIINAALTQHALFP